MPDVYAALLAALQEQERNRAPGRIPSGIAMNQYLGDVQTQRRNDTLDQALMQSRLDSEALDRQLKGKTPLDKEQEQASVRDFLNRRDAGSMVSDEPAAFTEGNFGPVSAHGGGVTKIAPRKITRTAAPMTEMRMAADRLHDPNYGAAMRVGRDAASLDPSVISEGIRANAVVQAAASRGDKLTKVEHKDPATGRTVIEWLPESQLRGEIFQKGEGATTENRLASAEAVNQTGNDMIAKLSDPAYARQVGVAMGRFNSLRDFIGNPPPEFADLAGMIESYSLANMGVHGMRSAQGAEQIKRLLEQKHTPESLIATIRGLNAFSNHFMGNAGRTISSGSDTGATGDPLVDRLNQRRQAK